MSAPDSERGRAARRAACVVLTCAALAFANASAQGPAGKARASRPAKAEAAPAMPEPVDGRYGVQVLAASVTVYASPAPNSTVLAQLQQGAQLESDQRRGTWYRIHLADGRTGWIAMVVGRANPNFSVDATPGLARAMPKQAAPEAAPAAAGEPAAAAPPPEAMPDDRIIQQRPMGQPLEAVIPEIDPRQVPPPEAILPRETIPVPDRWRLTDQLGLTQNRWFDPYHPNTLKGDRPVFGEDWFVALNLVSDTVLEWRQVPSGIGAQSTERPQSNDQFGRNRQSQFVQNIVLGMSLIKGDTTFKPPELELRFVPVINFNRTDVGEVRGINIDPRKGTTRNDSQVAVQELFIDYEYHIASVRYDFDDIRVGIQPFTADFRGLLFIDQPLGVRFFGTRDSNRLQYNVGWFRRLEKDTNSGLNDIGKPLRDENIFLANLYRQDTFVPGFALQGTVIYVDNREDADAYYDKNGFQVRPAVLGDARPRNYQVTYLGLNGDGHFGEWNLTASLYGALGTVSHDPLAQQQVNVEALYAVAEVSHDFDWLRVRGTGIFQSGDSNPFDGKATGFDAIFENPQIAGADTSYWIRQAVPLIGGGGVALSGRNGVLAALRSSKDQGQANFTNPGLALIGIGADADLTPRWRLIGNLNQLWFANTSSLSVLRNQGTISRSLGTDVSVAVQYRPLFSQNVIVNASAAALVPGQGLKQLYLFDGNKTQYSVLFNLLLTY
jgi:hypothetical protein